MNRIRYLCYYDTDDNRSEKRSAPPAAVNKISYICSALNKAGREVEIVSASRTSGTENCPGHLHRVAEKTWLRLFPCLGVGGGFRRLVRALKIQMDLFLYLYTHTSRNEPFMVYHSLGYAGLVWLLKKLKGFRLILEVEEIYADVTGNEKDRRREYRLFSAADAYIFPTELLNGKINTSGKPHAIIYGTYQVEADRKSGFENDKQHEKIHCVYAGTFDPRKGGAFAAAAAAQYLPANYHIHIIGFGSDADKKKMQELIDELSRSSVCGISFDGLLSGEEYIRFLQSCDIGLSTQNPDAAFNATSFPSKILSYMANGLRVVSIRIPAIEGSDIGPYMSYYDVQSPQEIAKAITMADVRDGYDSRGIIAQLDRKFVNEMKELLEGKNE